MFASWLVRIALAITLLGLGLWLYAATTRPELSLTSGGLLTSTNGLFSSGPDSAARGQRLIDASAPATFRFGFSFVVGFFFGWCSRQLLKLTLLVAGAIALMAVVLEKLGVTIIDWRSVQTSFGASAQVVHDQASTVSQYVRGIVPSAITAGAGAFWGFWRSR